MPLKNKRRGREAGELLATLGQPDDLLGAGGALRGEDHAVVGHRWLLPAAVLGHRECLQRRPGVVMKMLPPWV